MDTMISQFPVYGSMEDVVTQRFARSIRAQEDCDFSLEDGEKILRTAEKMLALIQKKAPSAGAFLVHRRRP
jgi:hypothetical protein